MRIGGQFLAFLGVLLATCGPAAAEAVFEPFADVVCRVEAESAQILKQTFKDGTPGPMSAEVVATNTLTPWHGMGVQVRKLSKWDLAWQQAASGGKVLMLRHSHRGKSYEPAKKPSPCARLAFRVPRAGRYYLFMKADSWCCGCQMLALRIDGGPDRVPGESWRGWCGDGWQWRSLNVRPSGLRGFEKPALPKAFDLAAGRHVLELVCATPLCAGVALDELVVARKFRLDLRPAGHEGRNVLHLAVAQGCEALVRLALAQGADADVRDAHGYTPLMLAAKHGHADIAKLLLAKGAKVNLRSKRGRRAMQLADNGGHRAVMQLLRRHGSIPADEEKAFLAAIRESDLAKLKAVVGRAPLLLRQRHFSDRQTPLHIAARRARPPIALFLLATGAAIDARDGGRYTPLHYAAWCGDEDTAKTLADKGADVHLKNKDGETPLHLAAWGARVRTVGMLIAKGASVGAKDAEGRTPLHRAAQNKRPEVLLALIAAGAAVNARDNDGYTPLHNAACGNKAEMVECLLDRGADPNAASKDGVTPLDLAVQLGFLETVRRTRRIKEWRDPTLRRHAANERAGRMSTIELLRKHGARVDSKDTGGRTPLFSAINFRNAGAVRYLVAHGANVNTRAKDGQTPLHLAVERAALDIIELLLANGADPDAKDGKGRTPAECAWKGIRPKVDDLVRRARASTP